MKNFRNVRTRIGVLVAVLMVMALGSVPLLGTAQDTATPTGGEGMLQEGQNIYENVCLACHQAGGVGIEGVYPPMNNNPLITQDDPTYLITVLLTGRGGMPTFASIYTDEEIAAVSTYVRQAWDNEAGPVDVDQVAGIRQGIFEAPAADDTTQDEAQTGTPEASPEQTTQDEATSGEGTPEATP